MLLLKNNFLDSTGTKRQKLWGARSLNKHHRVRTCAGPEAKPARQTPLSCTKPGF